jgi:hypothetical protein
MNIGKIWNHEEEVVKINSFHCKINMDSAGVIRRVVNKPRDIIPRNPAINPDVNIFFRKIFFC